MKRILIVFFILGYLSSAAAVADQPFVMPLGHNVSATSYTLHSGNCTIGLQTLACGVSDQFSLGLSPWLAHDYNMFSLLARWRFFSDEENQKTIQIGYFKTYEVRDESRMGYQMDLLWLYYIESFFLTPEATLHLNAQAMYYRDDTRPFSLRRPWVDRKPLQVNLTALNEVHISGGWYLNGELGILGVSQSNPQYLFAVTFEYRLKSWLWACPSFS